ncbi:MAG: NfeD family protein [Candidatus Thorarchaeota archaeon]|nr:NfeD family protein [Candidatus Thorarchaeota archaeon]
MVSPRVKFIAITIDELVLVPLAIIAVYYFLPDFFLASIIIGLIGSTIYVVIKYFFIYPSLLDTKYAYYELAGISGVVSEEVSRDSGKVKVGQEIWDARTDEGTLPRGTKIKIVSRESMIVRVKTLGND